MYVNASIFVRKGAESYLSGALTLLAIIFPACFCKGHEISKKFSFEIQIKFKFAVDLNVKFAAKTKDEKINFEWELDGMSDSTWANKAEEGHSIAGYIIRFMGALVGWGCRQIKHITLS